jgi:hypothetical protein
MHDFTYIAEYYKIQYKDYNDNSFEMNGWLVYDIQWFSYNKGMLESLLENIHWTYLHTGK